MKRVWLAVNGLGAIAIAAGVLVAAQAQELPVPENRPGYPTTARTYILNRTAEEAVPVQLKLGGDVQPVEIAGTPTVQLAPAATVAARSARQLWEYRVVEMSSDIAQALNEAGAEGWEAIGTVGTGGARSGVLLKRPR